MAIFKYFQCGETNSLVYFIVILFGIGSWVAVNGVWVELPVLVEHLPEGWNLPSYLTVLVQLANVGPIALTVVNLVCFRKLAERYITFVLILIGIISTFLLAFYWNSTAYISGSLHSIGFFIPHFFLSLVDCTSSVVFLPFMATFKSQYITAYFIGEGFSGLLPSMVALGQGAGRVDCVNRTVNGTNGTEHRIIPEYIDPRFPVEDFFFFLFAMMILCGIAFILLNYMPDCKKEHELLNDPTPPVQEKSSDVTNGSDDTNSSDYELSENSHLNDPLGNSFLNPAATSCSTPTVIKSIKNRTLSVETEIITEESLHRQTMSTGQYIYYLLVIAWINALINGVLPSVQSYSCLPYGTSNYHIAVVLSNVANPVACFVAFFIPVASSLVLSIVTLIGTGFGAYIMVLASLSPNPPMNDSVVGSVVMIAVSVLVMLFLTFAKVSIAALFREEGRKALFWCGAITQAGSALGAIVLFVMVNVYNVFQQSQLCS
ncbi:hypothetical protein ScPMuIL_001194 [Solemya velum]